MDAEPVDTEGQLYCQYAGVACFWRLLASNVCVCVYVCPYFRWGISWTKMSSRTKSMLMTLLSSSSTKELTEIKWVEWISWAAYEFVPMCQCRQLPGRVWGPWSPHIVVVLAACICGFQWCLPSVLGSDVSPADNRDAFWSVSGMALVMALTELALIWESAMLSGLFWPTLDSNIPFRNFICCQWISSTRVSGTHDLWGNPGHLLRGSMPFSLLGEEASFRSC